MIDDTISYRDALARRESALATACVHAGHAEKSPGAYRALETPIVLSSAFGFDSAEHAAAAFR
ncbi:MAG: hypothetical protein ACREJX_02870, partial [Polyangiaceae bacterium]